MMRTRSIDGGRCRGRAAGAQHAQPDSIRASTEQNQLRPVRARCKSLRIPPSVTARELETGCSFGHRVLTGCCGRVLSMEGGAERGQAVLCTPEPTAHAAACEQAVLCTPEPTANAYAPSRISFAP